VHLRATRTKQWVRARFLDEYHRPAQLPGPGRGQHLLLRETLPGFGTVFTGSVSRGNPDLKPYESMNFDLSFGILPEESGIVSVGAFHKRIDNPVFSQRLHAAQHDLRGPELSSAFGFSGPENAD
jgi:hypothetical protein